MNEYFGLTRCKTANCGCQCVLPNGHEKGHVWEMAPAARMPWAWIVGIAIVIACLWCLHRLS